MYENEDKEVVTTEDNKEVAFADLPLDEMIKQFEASLIAAKENNKG